MKGRTIIELIDDKTGEREVIAENNMIGPAVQEIFNCSAKHPGTNELLKHLSPLFQKMFGGLLLFEDPVAETEKTVPASNKIVGAGAYNYQNLYSNVNGDYNANESEVTATYAKHVWDFKTNQANGRISAICLCDAVYTKQFLYGCDYITTFTQASTMINDSRIFEDYTLPAWGWGSSAYLEANYGNANSFGHSGGTFSPLSPHYVFFENDFSGYTTLELTDATTLTFKKWEKNNSVSFLGSNSFDAINTNQIKQGQGIVPILKETKTFTVPTGMIGKYPGFWFDNASKKLYIAYNQSPFNYSAAVANNGTATFLSFDFSGTTLASVTMTNGTFTNKTGVTINLGGTDTNGDLAAVATYGTKKYFAVFDGYLYTMAENAIYKIKVSDNSEVIKIQNAITTSGFPSFFFFSSNGYVFFGEYSGSTTYNKVGVVNTVKNTVSSCMCTTVRNASGSSVSTPVFVPTKNDSFYFLTQIFTTQRLSYPTFPFVLRNYLSTINNLAQPVVKTNDKSMKVTYILEQDTGGI